ncbi:MAG: T9SS type A sorting domain-containing protein [Bacteroidetes bacterium]|nr:T9SS type A sorting domain-containing protein [Bacteroidota bacterium]
MKKTVFIIFSLLFSSSAIHAQTWEFVGLDSLLIFHLYVEVDTIYAGTWDKINNLNSGLYYSSNGGANWTQLDNSLGEGAIVGLERNIDNTMYIIKCPCSSGSAGSLYKTTDNGQSWKPVNNISNNKIRWIGISPFNPNENYVIDSYSLGGGRIFNSLYKSTDRGNSWEGIGSFPGSSHGSILTFAFNLTDSMSLYVGVDTNFIDWHLFKSTDKGNNWFYVSTPPTIAGIHTDYFIPNRIYQAGQYISNDGGLNWFEADSGLTDTSYHLSFYQDKLTTSLLYNLRTDGLYASGNDTFYWDRLEGSEYLPLDLPSGFRNLKNITIDKTSKKIYLGTSNGIYRKGVVTNLPNENNSQIKGFNLEQNYPNPFNPRTTINYHMEVSAYVTLKVYDLLGNELAVLVDKEQQKGDYEVEFDGGKFSSGVYIYRVIASKNGRVLFTNSKQMILLK